MSRAKTAKLDWDHCLCHIRKDVSGTLTAFTEISWTTLLQAPAIRQDNTVAFLKVSDAQPTNLKGFYHRQC